jgi:protein gp37
MKNALIGPEISDEIDLVEVVTEILSGISHDEFRPVFRNWVERVQAVIDANRDYLSSSTLCSLLLCFQSSPLWRI